MFVNAQSIAHGLNLQGGGRAGIFHSLTWKWDDYWQLIKRIWRRGQRDRVFIHHVVAVDTIDEALCAALAGKGRTQGALLGALRAYSYRRPPG
jgi:SNF2 family DNA or RNA helicase